METELDTRIEFVNPNDEDAVRAFASADGSVLVQVVQPDQFTYSCLVYARYEWMRVDGTRRQFMYEARPGANRYQVSSWSEAIAYARSLTVASGGI